MKQIKLQIYKNDDISPNYMNNKSTYTSPIKNRSNTSHMSCSIKKGEK